MNLLVLWFVKITGFIPALFYFNKKIIYEDKSVSSRHIKGKAILVSNHTSVMDFALYMFVFLFRNPYVLAAEVLFQKTKLFSWFIKCLGCIRVNRRGYDFSFIPECVKHLNKGRLIEVFPESRLHNKLDKDGLLEFKPSYVYIALDGDAPIIPLYTAGGYGKKGKTKVVIGKPIDVKTLYRDDLTKEENIKLINDYVKEQIIRLGEMVNEA